VVGLADCAGVLVGGRLEVGVAVAGIAAAAVLVAGGAAPELGLAARVGVGVLTRITAVVPVGRGDGMDTPAEVDVACGVGSGVEVEPALTPTARAGSQVAASSRTGSSPREAANATSLTCTRTSEMELKSQEQC
jgi:hypothetical protein